jgi:hypothetical protein
MFYNNKKIIKTGKQISRTSFDQMHFSKRIFCIAGAAIALHKLQTIETKNIKNATTSIFFRAYWRCKIT